MVYRLTTFHIFLISITHLLICGLLLFSAGVAAEQVLKKKWPGIAVEPEIRSLEDALQYNKPDWVLAYLKQGTNANGQMSQSKVPYLHYAFIKGDFKSSEHLLKFGADVYAVDRYDQTLLQIAMSSYDNKLLVFLLAHSQARQWQLILQKKQQSPVVFISTAEISKIQLLVQSGWDLTQRDENGNTALFLAIRSNNIPVARLFMQDKSLRYIKNKQGHDALYFSLELRDVTILKDLLNNGVDLQQQYGSRQQTALIQAVNNDNVEAIILLLKHGASPAQPDKRGENALIAAIRKKPQRAKVINWLLKAGAPADSIDRYNRSALQLAIVMNCGLCLDSLLAHAADVNKIPSSGSHRSGPDFSRPALFEAVAHGNVAMVRRLLQAGADIRYRDAKEGRGVMFVAAESNRSSSELLTLLNKYGANINTFDRAYWTPFMVAAIAGTRSSIEAFINNGADVNKTGPHGWSALMVTAQVGDTEKVKLLLKHGAKINATSRRGWTALTEAKYHHKAQAAAVLEKAGGIDPVNIKPKDLQKNPGLKIEIKMLD